ncbi:hypothetical protein MUY27_06275 [Mucilaginibacter sp. RS28]|uniref:DUF4468 domain-containing protein n=1 Tax=Mucilaginibacter straminoryzae TaxID=2932774 RepID=A0A9X1X146_9SPHI|nr:hypothetical protein [Mucilaginibacter straminoryzae]MCJ8209307.1 hypothetical protein [Mucilaginibacter straminoryzae]
MKKLLVIVIGLILFSSTSAQRLNVDIQELNIKDSTFTKNITNFIEEQKKGGDEFHFFKKGLGYVTVQIADYHKNDTLLRYAVLSQASSFNHDTDDGVYPQYYTFIDGHPVLLYFRSVSMLGNLKYSEKSKKKLQKVIEPFLEKKRTKLLYDVNQKKTVKVKNFRNEFFKFIGATIYYKLGRQYEN